MKRKITPSSLMFILLSVGKIGHIGRLGEMRLWAVVLFPLILDGVMRAGEILLDKYQPIDKLIFAIQRAQARAKVARIAKELKEKEGNHGN